jgi:tryptophanyl-tRNA synthetase
MSRDVILTGLRSNSALHIGNYLGSVLPMVKLQKQHSTDHQINFFLPDLHSFTTPIDHAKLYDQTVDNVRVFAALGLDITDKNTLMYRQSYVRAHSELTWILGCFTYFGELSRMTQFKEKSVDNKTTTAGLFTYPVLMAADILLYDALWVPLGDDQRQHLELARDLAIRFNNKFDEVFTVPNDWAKQQAFINRDSGVRIRSLRNPEKKMSKSVSDPAGTIMLLDDPKDAYKKVTGAATDSVGKINYDFKEQPGVSNLLEMLALLTDKPTKEVVSEWSGKSSYGDLKKAVAEEVASFLEDFQSKLSSVSKEDVISKLETDEVVANEIADKKLLSVQKHVGLRP